MSLTALSSDLLYEDYRPQAIIRMSQVDAGKRFELTEGSDDLDLFIGAAFLLNGSVPFAIKHYAGHHPQTFTVYLPPEISEVGQIVAIVRNIAFHLELPGSALLWNRSHDPDL